MHALLKRQHARQGDEHEETAEKHLSILDCRQPWPIQVLSFDRPRYKLTVHTRRCLIGDLKPPIYLPALVAWRLALHILALRVASFPRCSDGAMLIAHVWLVFSSVSRRRGMTLLAGKQVSLLCLVPATHACTCWRVQANSVPSEKSR